MGNASTDTRFAGSIPRLYDQLLVPMIFAPYAADIAARAARLRPRRVLEIAAGTGVVTRELARVLPAATEITATDLNQPMIDHAASVGTARPVSWRQADAMKLPFPPESFDLVLCQFGVMFFPDKPTAFAEVRRVLRPGGSFLFNVWDRIEANDFADHVTRALAEVFPDPPPDFMARTPHGYHDLERIAHDLAAGGFTGSAMSDTLPHRSRAASALQVAIAYCQGTPLRNDIEPRGPAALERATQHAAARLAQRFGEGEVDGGIQAHVVMVAR